MMLLWQALTPLFGRTMLLSVYQHFHVFTYFEHEVLDYIYDDPIVGFTFIKR